MENYSGEVFTLETGESYLIINSKEMARGIFCIGITMTEPVELKIIEVQKGSDDELQGCLYAGEDYDEMRKELLGYEGDDDTEMWNKILEHLNLIKTQVTNDDA